MAAINKIEREVEIFRDVNMSHDSLKELIFSEMDRKLLKRACNSRQSNTTKSFYKPYWSVELDIELDAVSACERIWLRSTGSAAEK